MPSSIGNWIFVRVDQKQHRRQNAQSKAWVLAGCAEPEPLGVRDGMVLRGRAPPCSLKVGQAGCKRAEFSMAAGVACDECTPRQANSGTPEMRILRGTWPTSSYRSLPKAAIWPLKRARAYAGLREHSRRGLRTSSLSSALINVLTVDNLVEAADCG
jgi:hypothetical protein